MIVCHRNVLTKAAPARGVFSKSALENRRHFQTRDFANPRLCKSATLQIGGLACNER